VFHVLAHIPEQSEDIYSILMDGSHLIRFEISYSDGPYSISNAIFCTIAEARNKFRQGKTRLALDRAVADAKAILSASCDTSRVSHYP
jgi:hypothetical protein